MSTEKIIDYNNTYCYSDLLPYHFLKNYTDVQPKWGYNGLGYIVYRRTYARKITDDLTEEWWQTVARCINGAQKIGAQYTEEEARRLYDLVFNLKCNFAGRMLWQLGTSTVDRFGLASLVNCWFTSMRTSEDFCFLFEHLMLGGGVGFSVKREDIHELSRVKKNVNIQHINTKDADFIVPDSRQGWVELLRKMLQSWFSTGKSFTYSTILVRGSGEPIKGFGGTASGPQILIEGLQQIATIFKNREGKKLRSIDVLDINNIIGSIVVAGNVRRCLPFDSLVHCEKGLYKIEDVEIGDKVLTSYGYKSIKNKFKQGVQKTINIKTQDGYFECTPTHKMAKLISPYEYEWTMAKDLQLGDRLTTTRRSIDGQETVLPSWSYEKVEHSTTCQDIVIPTLDEDLAWFLGVLHGGGHVYANREHNGFNAYVNLVFGSHELDIAERAKLQLERFGVNNVTLKPRKDENSIAVSCVSKQLAWYLDENFKKPKTEIVIPECIMLAEREIKLAYVSGVLDSDGASNNRPVMVVSTVYKSFALGIQRLLYSCGIESRYSESSDEWESRPSHWQKQYFISLITNYSKLKLTQNGNLEKDLRLSTRSQNANSYPSEWVEHHKRQLGAHSRENVNLDKFQSYEKLPLEFIPCEIVGFEEGREVETYDIEVEDVHEFYCNGYLTHNSAEIAIGDPDDYLYLRAKNWSEGNVPNWRDKSNNTIFADTYSHISSELWNNGYVIDAKTGNAKGEAYGFMNLPLCRKYGRLGEERPDNCEGTNPCQPTWAKILTKKGIRTFGDIEIGDEIWSKEGWTTVTKKISTGIKPVFEYKTTGGIFYGTENHRVISNGGEVEVGDADSIDSITGEYSSDGIIIDPQTVMDGLVIGDGSVHKASNNLVYLLIGEKDGDYHRSEISHLLDRHRPGLCDTAWEIKTSVINSELDKTFNRVIPERFYYGDKSTVASFLRGLYTANGSICGTRVSFKTTSEKLRDQVQTMLSSLGIRSYYTTNKPSKVMFLNGEYTCKESYDVNISTDRNKFYNLIGFIQKYKTEKLEQIVNASSSGKGKITFDIKDVTFISEEEVFDITVDNKSHTYWTQGCDVHNCGEVTLADGEPCNLGELYLNNISSKEELFECAKLLYKTQKAVWTLPALYEKTEIIGKKNRRIGLGVTGICQSMDKLDWLDECYLKLRDFDKEWSLLRGWPESIKLSTIKPSGSLSLLAGSTPGGHPAFAKYYIRRVRMASNDSLVKLCREAGYKTEYAVKFDGSEDYGTIIVEFPCESGEAAILSADMTAIDQLELVKKLQTIWSDNSVSVTIYYKPEELEGVQAWLKENYESSSKSLSFMLHSNHGFKQAPYEEIDEKTYQKLCKKLKVIDASAAVSVGILDGLECEGGACPLR